MTEAVIVATARSPIGRANKGSLVSLRPDDMSAQILQALLAKAPQVQASHINDVMWGIGQPAGEGGFNIARVISSLAGLDDVPGVTVNRYCSSSLQTIRMAFHAIKAGEVDWVIPHQANIRIMDATMKKLHLPHERLVVTVDMHGNTSAASIPMALDLAVRDGRIRPGHRVMLLGVGGGFTWGSVFLRW